MRLLDYLIQHHPAIKRTTFKRMLQERRITLNGQVATRLKQELAPSDRIEIFDQGVPKPRRARPKPPPPKPVLGRTPHTLPLRILYEDDDLLVVLKPAGLLTSTTERETRPTLAAMVKEYLRQTSPDALIGIIHRLDRDASGLLVFTKHPKAYHHLKRQLFHRTVDRVYTAVIEGVPTPKDGRIENWLKELPDGRVVRTEDRSEGQLAVTHYQTLATVKVPKKPNPSKAPEAPGAGVPLYEITPGNRLSLLRIKLHTGRKHQIRAHFAARKTPIAGDPLYGLTKHPKMRLLLAATALAFDHPRTKKRLTFEIEPPKEIRSIFPEISFATATPADG
ncbi:MAG TPA: RluA family pseudouridine synthase [Tepidisphaeraceae bacterium]|jgi:23S rRNA-/tRNA-specific pseudouridylate synthase